MHTKSTCLVFNRFERFHLVLVSAQNNQERQLVTRNVRALRCLRSQRCIAAKYAAPNTWASPNYKCAASVPTQETDMVVFPLQISCNMCDPTVIRADIVEKHNYCLHLRCFHFFCLQFQWRDCSHGKLDSMAGIPFTGST